VETYDISIKQGLQKSQIQGEILQILKDEYVPQGQPLNQQYPEPTFPSNSQEPAINREINTAKAP
jgi:hypothetical protein